MAFLRYLFIFGLQEARSCLFAVIIFLVLAGTKVIHLPGLHRYDWLLILCVLAQLTLVACKLETWRDVKATLIFHGFGLVLELYKVHMGSWSYPEDGYTKFAGVPLYSGFMYAAVGSYMIHSWKYLKLDLVHYPSFKLMSVIGLAVYLNFFTHHYIYDMRWILTFIIFAVLYKSKVAFTLQSRTFYLSLPVSFFLIGFFIWVAENITTYLGAWTYPDQSAAWSMVHIGKITSWFLLAIISFIIVAEQNRPKKATK